MPKKYPETNYHEILSEVSKRSGYSKKEVYDIYNDLRDTIVDTLKKGQSVKLPRLATFELVDRPSRRNRSPRDGSYFTSPPKTVVKVRNKRDLVDVSNHVKPGKDVK